MDVVWAAWIHLVKLGLNGFTFSYFYLKYWKPRKEECNSLKNILDRAIMKWINWERKKKAWTDNTLSWINPLIMPYFIHITFNAVTFSLKFGGVFDAFSNGFVHLL